MSTWFYNTSGRILPTAESIVITISIIIVIIIIIVIVMEYVYRVVTKNNIIFIFFSRAPRKSIAARRGRGVHRVRTAADCP